GRNRLRSFTAGPLRKHPLAPLAALELATVLRSQDNAGEAVKVLTPFRRQDAELLKDPPRAAWVPLLRFHHAAALQEAGRHPEARALYEALRKQEPGHPLALESALQWGRSLYAEAVQRTEKTDQVLGTPNLKPAEREAAERERQRAAGMAAEARKYF